MDTHRLVASTTDPAFAVDLKAEIVAWNGASEEFFGYRSKEVLGRRCWEVLSGQDIFGNQYCGPGCPLIGMASRQEAVHRCPMVFRTASGERARVGVCTLVLCGESPAEVSLVHHLYRAESCGGEAERMSATVLNNNHLDVGLTPRERELLGHLAEGETTQEIARLLCISRTTVRNHIRHILRKLGAHSRLEAVAHGRRRGLI